MQNIEFRIRRIRNEDRDRPLNRFLGLEYGVELRENAGTAGQTREMTNSECRVKNREQPLLQENGAI